MPVQSGGAVSEVVGRFAERSRFQVAVEALRAVGFEVSDLSVLDTHEALSASATEDRGWVQTLTGLVGEIK